MKIKKHYPLFIIIIIKIIIIIYIFYPRINCLISGREWMIYGMDGQIYLCVDKYSDGGKLCKSSSECMGTCVYKRNNLSYCAHNSFPYHRSIESHESNEPYLMID